MGANLVRMTMTRLKAGVLWTGEFQWVFLFWKSNSLYRKLEKHISHVSKLHETLEGRIIARRNEL